ncbi:MAG TPA: family 1 glycosylhydrolase [Actinomycetota bacterium]
MSPLAFGVATAGFQVEGGFNGPGQPRNNWFDRESGGRAEPSGAACDSWNRWEEDLDAVAAMGLDWYRLSVEWARLQPSPRSAESSEPAWDDEAVDRYVAMLAGAKDRSIEPVVTLHHFTHPRWLGLDLWQRPEAPGLFAGYAAEAARRLGEGLAARDHTPPLKYVTTNEPNVLAFQTWASGMFPGGGPGRVRPMRRALDHLLAAHVLAYGAIHRLHRDRGWPAPVATTNTYTNSVYEFDRGLVDTLLAPSRGIAPDDLPGYLAMRRDEWFAIRRGLAGPDRAPAQRLADRVGRWVGGPGETALEAVYRDAPGGALDVVAVDLYASWAAGYLRVPGHRTAGGRSRMPYRDLWEDPPRPRSFAAFVRAATDHGPPVWILENGLCNRVRDGVGHPRSDGWTRPRYLDEHVRAVASVVASGAPVEGYVHWSLYDNYEWGSYEPRFGIHGVDRTGPAPKRLALDSMGDDAAGAYARLVAELREG